MDINDVFDDISLSENKFTDRGFQEGLESGQKKSYREGIDQSKHSCCIDQSLQERSLAGAEESSWEQR